MSGRPKDIGTAAETAVVRYLQTHGFPQAERRALRGFYDCGDVTGTPGICWEVKGGHAAETASDGQVAAWVAETETERRNARASVGILVLKRKGVGPANAGRYWALVPWAVVYDQLVGPLPTTRAADLSPLRWTLADAVHFLRSFGFGDPLEDEVTA